ncbi:RICIN domain-containing protein [Parablautia muri]|uniref:Ricin B lectin domain-containing protein n=1 Tax=Parablautia muri TaxID=2320879 RepID=A0A9X5BGS6_9FIRM|nr:RICIN domain-containing protein [Parablautia muri]NBJ92677.1 hypothetical protein [Parablautia muri]
MKSGKIAKMIIFIFLFVFLFILLQKLLTPKWIYGTDASSQGETNRFQTFYQLEKDSLDYITIGDSKSYYSINPSLIYAETGFTGYCLGCTGEGIGLTYYWMEEALKYQSPQYIFWDASALLSESSIAVSEKYEASAVPKALTYMKFGPTKIRACIENQIEERNWLQLLIPMLSFHTRWKELEKVDFSYDNSDYALLGSYLTFEKRNFSDILQKNKRSFLTYDLSGNEKQENRVISEKNKQYFEKMFTLCKVKKVTFIPFIGQTTVLTDDNLETISNFLEDYDLECLIFGDEEMGIAWDVDTPDTGTHLNYWGACKYSKRFAEYLKKQRKLGQNLHSKVREYWDNNLELYREFETENLIDSKEQTLSYMQVLEANKDNLCIIIAVKDDACASFYGYIEGYIKRLGLQNGFNEEHVQNSYIAVIDKGKVLFDRWAAAPLKLEDNFNSMGKNFYIESGGYVYGDISTIQIDDINYAVNKRGLNIVVLDSDTGKVISSVSIDTHDESLSFTEKEMDKEAETIWNQYVENTHILQDGIYTIHPYGNLDYALDISEGSWSDNANLQLWNSTGKEPQQFELQYVGEGLYTIRAVNSGKYLTAYRFGNTNETNVVQNTYTGLANQRWYIYRDRNGAYCVMSHYNKLMMDVAGTVSNIGANIFLYKPVQGNWQTFEFKKIKTIERKK